MDDEDIKKKRVRISSYPKEIIKEENLPINRSNTEPIDINKVQVDKISVSKDEIKVTSNKKKPKIVSSNNLWEEEVEEFNDTEIVESLEKSFKQIIKIKRNKPQILPNDDIFHLNTEKSNIQPHLSLVLQDPYGSSVNKGENSPQIFTNNQETKIESKETESTNKQEKEENESYSPQKITNSQENKIEPKETENTLGEDKNSLKIPKLMIKSDSSSPHRIDAIVSPKKIQVSFNSQPSVNLSKTLSPRLPSRTPQKQHKPTNLLTKSRVGISPSKFKEFKPKKPSLDYIELAKQKNSGGTYMYEALALFNTPPQVEDQPILLNLEKGEIIGVIFEDAKYLYGYILKDPSREGHVPKFIMQKIV